jgi:hypothetical protein
MKSVDWHMSNDSRGLWITANGNKLYFNGTELGTSSTTLPPNGLLEGNI